MRKFRYNKQGVSRQQWLASYWSQCRSSTWKRDGNEYYSCDPEHTSTVLQGLLTRLVPFNILNARFHCVCTTMTMGMFYFRLKLWKFCCFSARSWILTKTKNVHWTTWSYLRVTKFDLFDPMSHIQHVFGRVILMGSLKISWGFSMYSCSAPTRSFVSCCLNDLSILTSCGKVSYQFQVRWNLSLGISKITTGLGVVYFVTFTPYLLRIH